MQVTRITTFSPNNFAGVTRAPQRSLVVLTPFLLAKASGFMFRTIKIFAIYGKTGWIAGNGVAQWLAGWAHYPKTPGSNPGCDIS
jgi:hypothetical protein